MNSATVLLVLLLLVCSLNLVPLTFGSRVIEVPKDYSSIQLAIEGANPGDIIKVAAGTYSEKVRVTKSVSLIGEGPEKTVIKHDGSNATSIVTVVRVHADNVEISGFTVKGGTYGIFLRYCSGAVLRNNNISANNWNFGVWGDSLSHFVHDIDSSNTVDGKPVYFWVNQHGKQVPTDAGYVAIVNCTDITVKDADLTSNEQGVLLVNTNESIIRNVTMSGNDVGIDLRTSCDNTVTLSSLIAINWLSIYVTSSHNNTFTENTIREGGSYGISTRHSGGNIIYHNNFINNTVQQYQVNSSSKWNDGGEGNYWSDYNGTDLDGDGVGDTLVPHWGVDYYPLMSVYDTVPPIADAGEDQKVFENALVDFNASGSTDNVGIDEYLWDFGDGSVGDGVTTQHTYAVAGNYTVTLTVEDGTGNSATHAINVIVVKTPEPVDWRMVIASVAVGAAAVVATIFWMRRRSIQKRKEDMS